MCIAGTSGSYSESILSNMSKNKPQNKEEPPLKGILARLITPLFNPLKITPVAPIITLISNDNRHPSQSDEHHIEQHQKTKPIRDSGKP